MTKPSSLTEFAAELQRSKQNAYCDTLPAEVQEQLITADVSAAVCKAWLISLGFEARGVESWRQKKRAERGTATKRS